MKSNASDFTEMWSCIYQDACSRCSADVSNILDLVYVRSRAKHEGDSFFTITLPTFAKDFEKSLEAGVVETSSFRNFRKNKAIPSFLQGMLSLVFCKETGRIIDEVSDTLDIHSTIIDSIRQLCLAFKKVELECTPQRVQNAFDNFVQNERVLETFKIPDAERDDFLRVSDLLWGNVLADFCWDNVVPRHGPGKTADRISGNQKFRLGSWYERLEPWFPVLDNAFSVSAVDTDEFQKLPFIPIGKEQPVRVVAVPKTLKAPRIIAIEPVVMQYTQQGIKDELYRVLEMSWLTAGRINFSDQTINQSLAIAASLDRQLCTIDLTDASDNVPLSLAQDMFRTHPDIRDAILACRSERADVNGEVIHLHKFASMGSALCFPIEAMYFYTICIALLLKEMHLSVTNANISYCSRNVHVYGDDIIVPSTYAEAVLVGLRKYNCRPNTSKTFVTGWFRESCGVDAYKGVQVTPVYVRKVRPRNRQDATGLVSWVETANLFYKKGYWRTSSYMFSKCEKVLGPLPYVDWDSPVLGRHSFLGYKTVHRWNKLLHRFEVNGWQVSSVNLSDEIDGYAALQKCFLSLHFRNKEKVDNLSSFFPDEVDKNHLRQSALRGAITLKRRWAGAQ